MASRRMLEKEFIFSDSFTALNPTAQLLYIRMALSADDEGFLSNARVQQRLLGTRHKPLQVLEDAGLIHTFDSGVTLILHWNIHNKVRKTTFIPTRFIAEKALVLLDNHKVYRLKTEEELQQDEEKNVTQDRLDKDSICKDNILEDRADKNASGETLASDSYSENFLLFWNNYPNKAGKQQAFAEFKKVDAPIQVLLEAIEKKKKSPQWINDKGMFIPNPANWLKRRGWEDVIEPPQKDPPPCGATGHLGPEELAAIQRALKEGIIN